jgi:hypothetical protein
MARASSGEKQAAHDSLWWTVATSFLADHDCVAWRAGLTLTSDADDGQGKVTPVARLLAKDESSLLKDLGVAVALDNGTAKPRASASLIVTNDSGVSEAALVPRKAFIDTVAEPFEQLFLETPVNSGNMNEKVTNEGAWGALENTGSLVCVAAAKDILGVAWQNAEHEKVQEDFPRSVPFSFMDARLKAFPVVVLGCDDTQWILCPLGKESCAAERFGRWSW